ncbi:MAG: APC family permease [Candidatus Micrarchaeia archaeon]
MKTGGRNFGKESSPRVFVRQSTGLVKNASFLDAVSINISNMSAGAALATIGFTTVLLSSMAGVNLVIASILAFILMLPQLIIYTIMNRRVPRTGGDYVWTSRIFGGALGGSLALMGYVFETMAYFALIALSTVFAIGSVGVALGKSSFLGLALPANTSGSLPLLQFIIAAVLFAILIYINIVRPKVGYKLVTVFVSFGIIMLLVSIAVLLLAGRPGVESYISSLQSTGFNETYSQVAASGGNGGTTLSAVLFLLPFFAIFVYPWIDASPAISSEIRGKKGIKWAIPVASLIVMLLVTGSFAAMYYAGGTRFINGALSNPTLVFDYSFNFWTLAMGVTGSYLLKVLIGLGWIAWDIAILAYGIIVFSRYVFAMAFDRFLPERLAHISPRYGSPINAHLLDLAITVVLIALATFIYGPFSSLYGAVVAAMIYFAFVGIAAAVYGIKNESQALTKGALVVFGILTTLVFAYITYQFLAYPSIWGGNALAYGYVVVSFLVGIVLYAVSKKRYAKRGIDIGLAFKEIPPE